jgi:2',3'-cyclic-nucleotide 2'-phosphodiesterase (5'-nucleotidase family)
MESTSFVATSTSNLPEASTPHRSDGITRARKILFAVAVAVVAVLANAHVCFASTLVGWDVHALTGGTNNFGPSPLAATVSDPNLTVGGLARGSGVGTTGSGAARGWGGNTWTTSADASTPEATAVAANQFATFTVTAETGYSVSFSQVSQFNYRRSSTGPAYGELQVQVGGGAFTDIAFLSYSSTSSSGASLTAIGLSTVSALQNVPGGTTVTFRIVNWGGTSSAGTWYIFDTANTTANDLEIQGTVVRAPIAATVGVETAGDGTGTVVAAEQVAIGNSLTVYAVARDANGVFVSAPAANWSYASVTGGIVATDLVPAADAESAVYTPHAAGTATIQATVSGLTSIPSGLMTTPAAPTNPVATVSANPPNVAAGQSVILLVQVTPGYNPTSTGLSVTGDVSALGVLASAAFHDDGQNGDAVAGDNIFSFETTVPSDLAGGPKTVPVTVTDAQARTAASTITVNVLGGFTIFHVNDTHARVTPHKWIIPQHNSYTGTFENVGGAAYLASAMLELTAAQPTALVIDGGDVSEGNPIGDQNGNLPNVQFFQLLSSKLKTQRGRGMDAVVVGNHDVRSATYIANLDGLAASGVPVISVNVRDIATHTPHFAPYTVVTVNGTKIGILGYTTQAAEVGASLSNTLEVAPCDWNSTSPSTIHLASYVNDLRLNQGCDIVILAAHVGHSFIATDTTLDSAPAPALLVDDGTAKLPEIAVTGHWHTWASTVWQPEELNYKTIFTESSSYMKYIGELNVTGAGQYISSAQHVIRDADYTPDPDVQALIDSATAQYNTAHPGMPVDTVIGYTSSDLMLDDAMKWWAADEYPWSGNDTAGQWICDAMQWEAAQLFGQCDLAMESGGGVRADIPAGPVTYLQAYETYPWSDDTFYRVNMTGQDVINYVMKTGCDTGFSSALEVTAVDCVPTTVTFDGQPLDPAHTYTVAISSFMYQNPPSGWTWSDTNPLTAPNLVRDGIVAYMGQFTVDHPYTIGGARYNLNTQFSGGYRAVVTMLDDNDTKPVYDNAFIRLLTATPETLEHLGTPQVPTSLVNPDGTIVPTNRLAEIELYRSYLGFKTGLLHPGDIIETWGKGSAYGGNPEFVDQEGIYSNGVEFNVVGHDASLGKPTFVPSVAALSDGNHKNHYVTFLAQRTGTNTVADQYGATLTLWDATAYAAMTGIPGNVGDMLLVTGVPTMESYGLRFRCSGVTLGSTQGITSFPPMSSVSSSVNPLPAMTTDSSIVLSTTASVNNPTFTLAPVADAQVASGHATTNYGTSTNLYVESSAAGYGDERTWVKFDLSSIPSSAVVSSATLQLYNWKSTGEAVPAEAHAGTDDTWTETGITWSTQPAFDAVDVLDTQTLAAGAINVWYSWNVTSAVQAKLASNKLVSLLVKAAVEGSEASPAPSYAFDSKEYGSNAPVLQIATQAEAVTVAGVQIYSRFSTDNSSWSAWTPAPPSASPVNPGAFGFPQGYGYYEFYSVATDSNGASESAPPAAQSFVHYVQTPDYGTVAILTLGNLTQVFDGTPKPVMVTSYPAGLAVNVTYAGDTAVPVHVGSYPVSATVTQPGFTGGTTGSLTITQAPQSIRFGVLPSVTTAAAPFQLIATSTSGAAVTFYSDNQAVATVSGSTLTVVGVGTANIMAVQLGNGDYAAATPVVQPLVVTQAGTTSAPATPWWALALLSGFLLAMGWVWRRPNVV